MISPDEMVIFVKELELLHSEYSKCIDENIREKIYDDILFFSEIIKI